MTQELSTVTHVILFFDGSKKFLTTKMAQLILANSLSEADGFQLPSNAGYIRFSAIQKILLLGEYYQQYPDQRPVQLKKFESAPKPFWEHAKSGKAWEQIKRGYETSKLEIHGGKWEKMKLTDKLYKLANKFLKSK